DMVKPRTCRLRISGKSGTVHAITSFGQSVKREACVAYKGWLMENKCLRALAPILVSLALLDGQTVPPLDQRVRAAVSGFQAAPSLFAKNLDTGEAYGLRENERVRTASTIKLAIMAAVFDAVAHDKAKWTEELVLHDSDKVNGTGVIREFSDGTRLTIRGLVNSMIVVSDNTATNLLLDRFTADAVNAEMDALGLKQ